MSPLKFNEKGDQPWWLVPFSRYPMNDTLGILGGGKMKNGWKV